MSDSTETPGLADARKALAYADTLGRADSRPNFEGHLRNVLADLDGAVAAARLEGVKAGLAAAGRVCRLAELAQRRNGAVDIYAVGSRECALIIDEIDPAEVSDE